MRSTNAQWDTFQFIPCTIEEHDAEINIPSQSILNSRLINTQNRTQALRICTPAKDGGNTTLIYRGDDDSEDLVAMIEWTIGEQREVYCVILGPEAQTMTSEFLFEVEEFIRNDGSGTDVPDFETIRFPGGRRYLWLHPRADDLTSCRSMYQILRDRGIDSRTGGAKRYAQMHKRAVTCRAEGSTGEVELKIDRERKDWEKVPGFTLLDLVVVFAVQSYGRG
ncbi:hypothetical protein DFP72DRAFT_1173172 [Ephemerocybe angulata]|uniref:Uncharacterized protein n=1 Tax=Ephemerocybe angulata TaxID=980116 RepID=A0A8H6M347_9AGAR|nr:hypothetical protein DFP72DRAFT_1173172 [Tulosesus angulatus]